MSATRGVEPQRRFQNSASVPGSPDAGLASLEQAFQWATSDGFERADLVIESIWLPLLMLPTGPQSIGSKAMTALARHRVEHLYRVPMRKAREAGSVGGSDDWRILLLHRPGSPNALACALAQDLFNEALAAADRSRLRLSSVQPAFIWGRQLLGRRRLTPFSAAQGLAFWIWCEQDRALVSAWDGDQVLALNAGADIPSDAPAATRAAEAERRRHGLANTGPVTLAGWVAHYSSAADEGVQHSFLSGNVSLTAKAQRQGHSASL